MDYLDEIAREQRNQIEAVEKGFDPFHISPEDIEKGRKAQLGEIRHWKDGDYKMTVNGWEYVKGTDPNIKSKKKSEEFVYEEGKYYDIPVSKGELTALRKRFYVNRDGQVGTASSGFEISGDKTSISGKGKIFITVFKILNEIRSKSESVKTPEKNETISELDAKAAEDFAAKHNGGETKSEVFTSIPEVEKTLQAKLSFIEGEQKRLENNKRMWKQKLKEVIPSISLLKENIKLAGLELDPNRYSISKSGDSQDWKEGDKLYMSASLKPSSGFRFIKFDGYDSSGRDRKRAQLQEKAEKISEKLERGTSLRISVNPYSLQIDPRKGETGKSVMIEFWF